MNIIKLKDVIMTENNSIAGIFNTFLKGRYAYWIQMRYIVPFEFMKHEGYVACEEDITKLLQKADGSYPRPYGCPYIDMYSEDRCIMRYIDLEKTDEINDISRFVLENDNVPDGELTIDMLKNFRTWLAQTLLDLSNSINTKLDESTEHMLKYYANNMYDDIVKYLIMFSSTTEVKSTLETSCGCCSGATMTSLTSVDVCDPLVIYRKSIYNKMVEVFSNVDFWNQYPKDFIRKFKQYIDNIIKTGLVINKTSDYSAYKECLCSSGSETTYLRILNNLSTSLNYVITDNISGHKNYIRDSLYDWSSTLYEFMQW